MECDNFICIYQEDGKCILDRVSLDVMGQCKECILVTPDEETLQKMKLDQRSRE